MNRYILTLLVLFSLDGLMAKKPADEPVRPALLVMDMQNAYLDWMSQEDQPRVTQYINGSISLFREANLPVIRIYNTDLDYGPPVDSEEFKFAQGITIDEDDPMVIKNFGNGFKKTDLNKILKKAKVNTLFICGLSATGCVLATYHGALDLDYDTFLIKKALLSPRVEHTQAIENMMNTMPYSGLKILLKSLSVPPTG